MKLTPEQVAAEVRYRFDERIGILCGAAEPTLAQMQMAEADAEAWRQAYYAEQRTKIESHPGVTVICQECNAPASKN